MIRNFTVGAPKKAHRVINGAFFFPVTGNRRPVKVGLRARPLRPDQDTDGDTPIFTNHSFTLRQLTRRFGLAVSSQLHLRRFLTDPMKTNLTLVIFITLMETAISADSEYLRELKQLKEQREAAIVDATAPIERRYQTGLEQLLRRATQMNDLDAAIKIKEELVRLDPGGKIKQELSRPAPPNKSEAAPVSKLETDQLRDKLAGTFWTYQWDDKVVAPARQWVCLNADGTTTEGWHKERLGRWKVVGNMAIELRVLGKTISGAKPGEILRFESTLTASEKHQRIAQPAQEMLDQVERSKPAAATASPIASPSPSGSNYFGKP